VNFVTAAQAAHWFDRQKARHEFARILKPDGWLFLVWNERRTDSSAFLRLLIVLHLQYRRNASNRLALIPDQK